MPKPLVLLAIDALKQGDRVRAIALLKKDMATETRVGERWMNIARVAEKIGEIDLAIEAGRRFAAAEPFSLEKHLFFWGILAEYGREDQVKRAVAELDERLRNTAAIQHLLGTLAAGSGDQEKAREHFARAIDKANGPTTSWFALSMITRFEADDPRIAEMEAMLDQVGRLPPEAQARHHYALGKAYLDTGDYQRAMAYYEKGAAIRRSLEPFDAIAYDELTQRIISSMDKQFFEGLQPSGHVGTNAIFVNGVPRSGSTLIEQLMVAHSAVEDGGEINLFSAALLPIMGRDAEATRQYEEKSRSDDPWGDIAATYHQLLHQRFPGSSLIIDKTLMQSTHAGLLLHSMPDARMIWMRRSPADSAWSTFRNYFTSPLPWSWSFADIGRVYRNEDRLFKHWTALFPGRILEVSFEEFVNDPESGLALIFEHVGLPVEDVVDQSRKMRRQIRTASVAQVRQEISPDKVGQSQLIEKWLQPFWSSYED